jgi:hypothetical protein
MRKNINSLDKLAETSVKVKLPSLKDFKREKNHKRLCMTEEEGKLENIFSMHTDEGKENNNSNSVCGWDRILEETCLFDMPSKPKPARKLNLKLSSHLSANALYPQTTKNKNLKEYRNYFPNYNSVEK